MSPDHLSGAEHAQKRPEEAGGAASSAPEPRRKHRKQPVSVKDANINLAAGLEHAKMVGKGGGGVDEFQKDDPKSEL